MKTVLASSLAFVASAPMALAGGDCGDIFGQCAAVPEISALEGTAAIAAVLAVVALVWERRRRAT